MGTGRRRYALKWHCGLYLAAVGARVSPHSYTRWRPEAGAGRGQTEPSEAGDSGRSVVFTQVGAREMLEGLMGNFFPICCADVAGESPSVVISGGALSSRGHS